MTFKDKYLSSTTWTERACTISIYHFAQKIKNPSWTIAHTASYFDISSGKVSEDIKLVDEMDKVRDCLTRKDALARIK